MNKHIHQAIYDLKTRSIRYEKYERYYNGDHDLAFATEKFENTFGNLFREFALNLCPVICDAVRDKLRVTGFSGDDDGARTSMPAAAITPSPADKGSRVPDTVSKTRSIWSRNRMGTRAGEVHKEALKCGDAYMIVWRNAKGQAVLYPNRAANVTVAYDEDRC